MHPDGAMVTYQGQPTDELATGDRGKVMASTPTYAHVLWTTGASKNQVSIHLADDLHTASRGDEVASSLDDSLDVGELRTTAARAVFEDAGAPGVLARLSENGYLSGFAEAADEALAVVTAHLRADPALTQALAGLEESDADLVLRSAAAVVLQETLSDDFG